MDAALVPNPFAYIEVINLFAAPSNDKDNATYDTIAMWISSAVLSCATLLQAMRAAWNACSGSMWLVRLIIFMVHEPWALTSKNKTAKNGQPLGKKVWHWSNSSTAVNAKPVVPDRMASTIYSTVYLPGMSGLLIKSVQWWEIQARFSSSPIIHVIADHSCCWNSIPISLVINITIPIVGK